MKAFKNILIPTDFSDNALKAARFALQNYADQDVKFELIHTFYLYHSGAVITSDLEALISNDRKEMLDEQLKTLTDQFPEAQITGRILQGRMVDTVTRYITNVKNDLVVMGTQGSSGFKTAILGTNAANLMTAVDIPVILVPEKSSDLPIKKVLFASDLKKINNFDPLRKLSQMVHAEQMELEILNLLDESMDQAEAEKEEVRLSNIFTGTDYQFHYRKALNPEDGILAFAHEMNINMIAVIARHHGFISRMLHRSVSKRLAMHSEVPLLILKEQ